jgi:hypothetical protein
MPAANLSYHSERGKKQQGLYGLNFGSGLSILVLTSLAFTWLSFHDSHAIKDRAMRLAMDGISRLRETFYDNIQSGNFPVENIDVDGDGKSVLESREFQVYENRPYSEIKTIKVIVSWPDKTHRGLDPDGKPHLEQIELMMFVNKKQFS